MPKKTIALISGLVLVTIALFIIALTAPQSPHASYPNDEEVQQALDILRLHAQANCLALGKDWNGIMTIYASNGMSAECK